MIARPRSVWLFRLLAMLLALLPFLLAEALCWTVGWGESEVQPDPFVGFSSVQPLFELSPDGTQYQVAPSRLMFFPADRFPVTKSPGTKRIFCLGGSTVQGRPYSKATSFPTWMRLALETANPQTKWEVVNCGGISYASYRLVPILDEVLDYEPDLIILCTGHNEFLEDRSYSHIKQLPTASLPPLRWLLNRRLVVAGSEWVRSIQGDRNAEETTALLHTEVDALLDYQGGLAAYHRDAQWHADVRRHFEFNLNRVVAMCRDAKVPLLLLQPPSNLRGQPPFKSEPTENLSAEALAAAQTMQQQAIDSAGETLVDSIKLMQQALAANPDEPRWWYQLGQMQILNGDIQAARDSLVRARDLDICPLRMTSPLEATLQSVASARNVPFSNLHALLEQRTPSGILGDEWLVDHVHPSFDGHREIGLHLVEQLADRGWCDIEVADWRPQARVRFAEHFATLDKPYFHQGQRALQNLRGWAAGQVVGPPLEQRLPPRSPSKIPPVSH